MEMAKYEFILKKNIMKEVFLYYSPSLLVMFLLYASIYMYSFFRENTQKKKKVNIKKEVIGNKFHNILIKCVDKTDHELLLDPNWEWSIVELELHKYHVIGSHPIAKRIDYIKDYIVV